MLFKQIILFFYKEVRIEIRWAYTMAGLVIFLLSTIFIIYLSTYLGNGLDPLTWHTLFWIVMLFLALYTTTKSFFQENPGHWLYYYTLASPVVIIFAKIFYNALLLLMLMCLGYLFFSLLLGNPVQDQLLFIITIVLASIGFSAILTLIAAIATKATNAHILMLVLSVPMLMPPLLVLTKISKNAVDGLDRSISSAPLIMLLAIK